MDSGSQNIHLSNVAKVVMECHRLISIKDIDHYCGQETTKQEDSIETLLDPDSNQQPEHGIIDQH